MKWICVTFLIFGMVISASRADDSEESLDDGKKKFENVFGDSMKGATDFFKNTAEEVKERAQSGVETMKEFSDQAREQSESGAKDIAEGIGERFSKAKARLEESGGKMKEAFGSAVEKSKDEFESAASKISNHAKEASDTVFSLFGKF